MSAESALFDAYREWRRLAQACTRAIRLHNWAFLNDSHQVIEKLQPVITRLTAEARQEWVQSPAELPEKEEKLRLTVFELIELGKSNRALLQTALQTARFEHEELEQAGQNLKRVQQSYAIARPPAWSSFS